MATEHSSNSSNETTDSQSSNSSTASVDPRAPRFGQSITATLLLIGVVFTQPVFVYAVAGILGFAAVSRWRLDPYHLCWKHVVIPVLGRPDEPEPAAPHRFAKLLGAVGAGVASVLLVVGFPTVGYAIAALVALLAGLAATTGFCLGCRMYRQVSFLRSRNVL
ncbi:DUF4395 domain-containing protein [Natronorubrum texcoconense]|uniref:DUF4395 domain-containing protein n=1 Tax=Natronorubrum texcoconense TaxID=1095776 RepID=A0A1G8ZN98_9EURY|nr:DUF4395 domain-containing protein [Natronorubrum texcoconense]SDK16507.1 protein of unknown function [Natronorubrum texcoconense]